MTSESGNPRPNPIDSSVDRPHLSLDEMATVTAGEINKGEASIDLFHAYRLWCEARQNEASMPTDVTRKIAREARELHEHHFRHAFSQEGELREKQRAEKSESECKFALERAYKLQADELNVEISESLKNFDIVKGLGIKNHATNGVS